MSRYSRHAIMLACHETRCPWDVLGSAWHQVTDRTGRYIWRREMKCERGCGSVKIQKREATLVYIPIGTPKINRPPGWYDIKEYFGSATQRISEEGLVQVAA